MTKLPLIGLYGAFAAVAIALNVLVQRLVFVIHDGNATIFIAMTAGAVVALVVKYLLDRTFIFAMKTGPKAGEFLRYALTGGAITLIYFVVEYIIWITYRTEAARDIGIVLGMITGYGVKFLIDRKYVFVER